MKNEVCSQQTLNKKRLGGIRVSTVGTNGLLILSRETTKNTDLIYIRLFFLLFDDYFELHLDFVKKTS